MGKKIDKVKSLFRFIMDPTGKKHRVHQMHLATASMLIDLAKQDHHFTGVEKDRMAALIRKRFDLPLETIEALIEHVDGHGSFKAGDHAEVFVTTRNLRQHFKPEEQTEILEMAWEVVYADGKMHPNEETLMEKIRELLHVSSDEFEYIHARVRRKFNYTPLEKHKGVYETDD